MPQPHTHDPAVHGRVHRAAEKEQRAALTLDIELETLARLVLEARKRASTPARVIEQALAAHRPRPARARSAIPSTSRPRLSRRSALSSVITRGGG
ncbi:MAG: hypothetical protein U1E87_05645 [Alphaproteobacteria bacterium]